MWKGQDYCTICQLRARLHFLQLHPSIRRYYSTLAHQRQGKEVQARWQERGELGSAY